MRKTEYTLDATHTPNNLELVMAGLRIGLRTSDEVAEYAAISRTQAVWTLSQLSTEGHAEFVRGGSDAGWRAVDREPLDTVFVESESDSLWGVAGYPTGVIAPLVGRVHLLPG